jgi:hypothetical protein
LSIGTEISSWRPAIRAGIRRREGLAAWLEQPHGSGFSFQTPFEKKSPEHLKGIPGHPWEGKFGFCIKGVGRKGLAWRKNFADSQNSPIPERLRRVLWPAVV